MQNLTITLVQTPLEWQNPAANRNAFSAQLAALKGKTDLIILPEMFTSGFSMQPEQVAEQMSGETLIWLQELAQELNATICGSMVIQHNTEFRNRFLFVTPDGSVSYYDKRHLFRMGNEHQHYAPGTERRVFEYKGWRILPEVCYDLRFPIWSRNRSDYDLAIYVANWPAPRRNAWRTLLMARAIENQCYVAGVNRTGSDGNALEYAGDSMLVNYLGEPQLDLADAQFRIASTTLIGDDLHRFRESFPAWQDADSFTLN